jgi:hypothetical protein
MAEQLPNDPYNSTFPTAYAMGQIGVNDAREALEAFHFCSNTCRTQWVAATPAYTDGGWSTGDETLSIEGDCCTQCGKVLE